jgi:protein-tyrosine phosphatase
MPVSVLRRGVEAALPVIDDGYAVLVHCLAGVHRSVAMACCVLIGMGYSAEDAMQLVESKREVADPRVWYIRARIEKFERSWRARPPAGRLAAGG